MRAALDQALVTHAHRTALVTERGACLSFRELGNLGDEICSRFPRRNCLVFIIGGNHIHTIAAYTGAVRHGHAVLLLDDHDEGRLAALLMRYEPDVVIRCSADCHGVDVVSEPRSPIHPDIAILFSTSGTTGSPRLVKITASNILSNTRAIIEYLGLTENDRAITLLQPFYSFGLSIINSHLLAGASLLLTERSIHDPLLWQLMASHGVTSFSGVPHTFEACASSMDLIRQVRSLRYVTQAGGKLSRELVTRFAQAGEQQGWQFYVMYGQTEASPRISYLPPEKAISDPESIGIAIPGGELAIEREDGQPVVEPMEEGELVYSGPNVMAGYAAVRSDLSSLEQSTRLHTGDIAYRKANGLFVITGRKSRFIKPMGLRISLDDVEERLKSLGYCLAATADGDVLVLHVEHPRDATPASIGTILNLASTFIRIRHVDELPRLSNGKVDYADLSSFNQPVSSPWADPTRFLTDVAREFLAILLGVGVTHQSVQATFAEILGVPEIQPSDSFASLGGDSMSYVECTVFLESVLSDVPRDWHLLDIRTLESMRGGTL